MGKPHRHAGLRLLATTSRGNADIAHVAKVAADQARANWSTVRLAPRLKPPPAHVRLTFMFVQPLCSGKRTAAGESSLHRSAHSCTPVTRLITRSEVK